MALITFRDTVKRLVPWWLRRGVAEKLLYAIAIQLDALMDALVFGIQLRFPGAYSPESLPFIGRDRRILRGRNETDAVYGNRLKFWLEDHALRGGPYGMLGQLKGHFAADPFPIQLVYYSGRRFSMDAAGVVTMDDIVWVPDDNAAKWARWWLFYEWPTPIGDDGLWGDAGTYGDGGVWGSDLTYAEVVDLRAVPREWNNAHSIGRLVLLPPDAELWGMPEGTWGDPGLWGDAAPVQLGIG
jgi:hypothetical protein